MSKILTFLQYINWNLKKKLKMCLKYPSKDVEIPQGGWSVLSIVELISIFVQAKICVLGCVLLFVIYTIILYKAAKQ
jgi:hypothetical protein